MQIRPIKKAFTLIELIVVIVILGILAGIAVVGYNAVIEKSQEEVATATANSFDREVRALLAFEGGNITEAELNSAVAASIVDLEADSGITGTTHVDNADADMTNDTVTWTDGDISISVALSGTIAAGVVTAS